MLECCVGGCFNAVLYVMTFPFGGCSRSVRILLGGCSVSRRTRLDAVRRLAAVACMSFHSLQNVFDMRLENRS
eukprot:239929-Lingulodinium_polyedra.AAC.1